MGYLLFNQFCPKLLVHLLIRLSFRPKLLTFLLIRLSFQIEAYKWKGEFDLLAQTLIRQHVAQSNVSTSDQSLAEFSEFVAVHLDHPLSFTVFSHLLDHLIDIYPRFTDYQVSARNIIESLMYPALSLSLTKSLEKRKN